MMAQSTMHHAAGEGNQRKAVNTCDHAPEAEACGIRDGGGSPARIGIPTAIERRGDLDHAQGWNDVGATNLPPDSVCLRRMFPRAVIGL